MQVVSDILITSDCIDRVEVHDLKNRNSQLKIRKIRINPWVFDSGWWTKHKMAFSNPGCLLSKKVWSATRIGSFQQKNEVFYRTEWTKLGITCKWIFSIFKYKSECYECTFFDNLRTITQEGNMALDKWPHFFHLIFPL